MPKTPKAKPFNIDTLIATTEVGAVVSVLYNQLTFLVDLVEDLDVPTAGEVRALLLRARAHLNKDWDHANSQHDEMHRAFHALPPNRVGGRSVAELRAEALAIPKPPKKFVKR